MKIVGIDPSLSGTGIAHADGHTTRVRFGARPSHFTPDHWTARRVKIIVAAAALAAQAADLVVIEGYAYGAKQKREPLGFLGYSIRDELTYLGVPYLDIAPPALKKFATGNGNASKDAMKAHAVQILKLDPHASDDEADALWLRELGRHLTGESSRMPPSTHTDHLKKIELPEGIR